MKYYSMNGRDSSAVVLGMMRISGLDAKRAAEHISTALDLGVNYFDHADIYGRGECEKVFARAVKDLGVPRDKIIVQSKCGIVPGKCYDFSFKHIVEAVEGSLMRLGTDHLDYLLLHRPDSLMEPEEVGEAFAALHRYGKVINFGVSNFSAAQIKLLSCGVPYPLSVDQVQFGPAFTGMIDSGFHVNMKDARSVDHDGNLLEFARINKITLQAWSPYQYGFFGGAVLGSEEYQKLNALLNSMAEEKHTTPTALVSAWILRHPAHIQVIAGTTNSERLKEVCAGADITLTREEWYEIYLAAGNDLP